MHVLPDRPGRPDGPCGRRRDVTDRSSAPDRRRRRSASTAASLARVAHVDDLGAGEARQHRLHERVAGGVAAGARARRPGAARAASRRRARRRAPRPSAGRSSRRARARGRWRRSRLAALGERELDPALLEAHEPHVAFERALERDLAPLAGERDHVLEAAQRAARAEARPRAAGARCGRHGSRAPHCRRSDGPAERAGAARSTRSAAAGAPLLEEAQSLVRRRQIGGVAEAHQRPSRPRRAAASRPAPPGSPLSRICQARDSARIDSALGERGAADALGLGQAGSFAASGTSFRRVTRWVKAARSDEDQRRVGAGIVLAAQARRERPARRRASPPRTGR